MNGKRDAVENPAHIFAKQIFEFHQGMRVRLSMSVYARVCVCMCMGMCVCV